MKKTFSEQTFVDCITIGIDAHWDMIMKECVKLYGDTSEETGYKCGKAIFESLQKTMVEDCDTYFILLDSVMYASAFTGLNEDSLKRELEWFNRTSKAPDSSTFYSDRGILRLQLKDINGAYTDLEKALKLNKENIAAHFFRGWTLELKKEYARALEDFQYVADVTKDPNYLIMVAIVKRKKRMAEGTKK